MADLLRMAQSLINIHKEIPSRCKSYGRYGGNDFEIVTFEQVWENTSGGFEGIGGDMITSGTTYVLLPLPDTPNEPCQVYFDGSYAYSVPFENERFLEDVRNRCVAGKMTARRRYSMKPEAHAASGEG